MRIAGLRPTNDSREVPIENMMNGIYRYGGDCWHEYRESSYVNEAFLISHFGTSMPQSFIQLWWRQEDRVVVTSAEVRHNLYVVV